MGYILVLELINLYRMGFTNDTRRKYCISYYTSIIVYDIHTHTPTHTYIHTHTPTHAHTYTYAHVHVHNYTHTNIYTLHIWLYSNGINMSYYIIVIFKP